MLHKINLSIFLLSMFIFSGCKSIEINDVKKQLVLTGHQLGTTKINYTSIITSKKEFTILSLKIDTIDKEFKSFSVIELPSGKLKNLNQKLLPGKYFIELSIPESLVSKESIDRLTFFISIKNKRIELRGETFLDKNLLSK